MRLPALPAQSRIQHMETAVIAPLRMAAAASLMVKSGSFIRILHKNFFFFWRTGKRSVIAGCI
ncbi:MAG: hypothetical protein ABGX04_09445 [Myxococcales bacterium]